MLCESGFGDLYESRMSRQKPSPTSARDSPAYWTEVLKALPRTCSKPEVAAKAATRMTTEEAPVPEALSSILTKVSALAGA